MFEDLWCLYYPDDINQQFSERAQLLQQQPMNPMSIIQLSFAAFLAQLFPQLQGVLLQMIQYNPHTNTFGNSTG